MKILRTILYNGFSNSLRIHENPEVFEVKEHVCGKSKPIEESKRLFTSASELKMKLDTYLSAEYDMHECILDNGNVMFTLQMYHKGVPFIAVPLKSIVDTDGLDLCVPEDITAMGSPYKTIPSNEYEPHLQNMDEEKIKTAKESFKVIDSIPEETPVRCIESEKYLDMIKRHCPDSVPPANFIDDANVGLAVTQTSKGYEAMKYSTVNARVEVSPINADNGDELLLCVNESARVFEAYDVENTDILEGFYICNKNSLSRKIEDIYIAEAMARVEDKVKDDEIKATKSSNTRSPLEEDPKEAVSGPKGKKLTAMRISVRGLIAKIKRANDDELREKVYRDEFIPIFDDFFEVITTGGITAALWTMVNPLFAILLGLLTYMVMNWKQGIDRRRVKELLDDKIQALEEEIDDARSENDLAKKRRLSEIKRKLERKRAKITVGGTLGAR